MLEAKENNLPYPRSKHCCITGLELLQFSKLQIYTICHVGLRTARVLIVSMSSFSHHGSHITDFIVHNVGPFHAGGVPLFCYYGSIVQYALQCLIGICRDDAPVC
jgi:hypothetical protein